MDKKEKRQKIKDTFIFSWAPPRHRARTFVAFLIFSAVIHFLGFYLFIVEYPQSKTDVRSDSITLLDPNNIEVQSFLRRIEDRIVHLEPASYSSAAQVKLSDYAIRFAPSFAEVEATLKPPIDSEPLSYFETPQRTPRIPGKDWQNPLRFSRNLEKRGVANYTILDDYLSLFEVLPELRINLTIDPTGKPIDVNIPGDAPDEEKAILGQAIRSTLRFQPIAEELGNDPGWMEIQSR